MNLLRKRAKKPVAAILVLAMVAWTSLLSPPAQATTTQIRSAITIGWANSTGMTASTLALSNTATWLGFSFTLAETKTLSKVRIYTTAASGLGATDLECHIFDSATGAPNASQASVNTVTTTPTGARWTEFTGFTYSLTGGKTFWAVSKMVNAAASVTYQWSPGGPIGLIGATSATSPWSKKHSTDSGASWVSGVDGVMGLRLEFSDGSFDGFPWQSHSNSASADGVYGSGGQREVGAYFTLPGPATLQYKVRGVAMHVLSTGTPTGFPTFNIRAGATPGSPTTTANVGTNENDFASGAWHYGYFSSTLTMTGGTVYRVTLSETAQSDTSGNRYNTDVITIENDANSKALMLFGSCQKTYYNGSVWTETSTDFVPFLLILDTDGPLAKAATGLSRPRLMLVSEVQSENSWRNAGHGK